MEKGEKLERTENAQNRLIVQRGETWGLYPESED